MSSERKPVITKLSQAVLELKFMKKTKEKVHQQLEDEERQTLYHDQLANLQSSADRVVLIGSHYDMKQYLPCRLSFGGMDPLIEKLMESQVTGMYKVPKMEPKEEKEVDVTEQEMAEHFSSLNENLCKKFKIKRPKSFGNKTDSNMKRGNKFGPGNKEKRKKIDVERHTNMNDSDNSPSHYKMPFQGYLGPGGDVVKPSRGGFNKNRGQKRVRSYPSESGFSKDINNSNNVDYQSNNYSGKNDNIK